MAGCLCLELLGFNAANSHNVNPLINPTVLIGGVSLGLAGNIMNAALTNRARNWKAKLGNLNWSLVDGLWDRGEYYVSFIYKRLLLLKQPSQAGGKGPGTLIYFFCSNFCKAHVTRVFLVLGEAHLK